MQSSTATHKPQYIAALSASMGALALGTVLGYSSPAAPLLMVSPSSENHTTQINANATWDDLRLIPSEFGWFSSSANLGAVVGGIVGGIASNRWGRRITMLLSAPPFLLGWILIALSQNLSMLLIGRILTGICMGATCTAAPPYIAEIASPHMRGILGSAFQVMLTSGILYSFVVGSLVHDWRWLAGLCVIPPVVYFILIFFAKESPVFLLSQGKNEQAQDAMKHFRGKDYDIQREMEMVRESIKETKENSLSLRDLSRSYIIRPLIISVTLMFFQQFSGVPAVMFNLTTVFKASGIHLSENLCAIILGIVQVVATAVGGLLIDKAGRKILLIISSSSMAISIVSLGVYFYMRELWPEWTAEALSWLPLLSLVIFISTFSIGFGPVPWVMMGELFPENARELAAGLATAGNWTSAFIVTLVFIPLRMVVGDYGVYWIFGGICSSALFFSTIVVPETKGKTLQEITRHFEGSSGDDISNTRL